MATIPELLALAIQRKHAGQPRSAEQLCRQILAAHPDQPDAWHLLGVIAHEMGQHQLAVECIGRALQFNQTQPAFYANLGNAYQALGKLNEALACVRRALELNPLDPVIHYNLGNLHQFQGQLDEAIDFYRRAVELNPDFAEAHTNLGHAYQSQSRFDEAIAAFDRALHLKPDLAPAHNNLGNVYWMQGRLEKAFHCYHKAVDLQPNLPEAQSNLGNAYQFQGKLDEAAACCRRALELNPNYILAHLNLGNALLAQGKADQAVASYRRALELKPDDPDAHNNLANALQQLGQFDEALRGYERALQLKPNFPSARFGRANLKLLLGDFASGWPEYDCRFQINERIYRKFVQPKWDGSPLGQRTILLEAEQGLGDTIQFVRYAKAIKKQHPAATVIVEAQPPLMKLLATCPGIDRLIPRGDSLPSFDVRAPVMALPGIMRTTLDTIPADFPYVAADPAIIQHWRDQLKHITGLKVGINWRGRPISHQRGIPVEYLSLLTELPGVRLISLQKGASPAELAAASGNGPPILDLGENFDTASGPFMDTAAVMQNLDLVIACDTSVAHLAGALGVPVWLALPFVPDWRWLLDRTDSPWYPTMRLFRQKQPGDWASVFQDLQSALHSLCQDALNRLSNH